MPTQSRPLNPQQQTFADAFAATGNAEQSALAAGYSATTARRASVDLVRNPRINSAIISRQQANEGATEWNREEWLRRTARLFDNSEDSNPATAAKCLELLGRAIGVFQDTGLSDRERDAFAWLGRSMLQAASGEPQQLADGSSDSSSDGEPAEHSDGGQRNRPRLVPKNNIVG